MGIRGFSSRAARTRGWSKLSRGSKLLGSFSNDNVDGNENAKKTINLITKTTTSARALHFLLHFLAVTARLRREISRWDVLWRTKTGARRLYFVSLSKLGCGLQEFDSRKSVYLHLSWINREDICRHRC